MTPPSAIAHYRITGKLGEGGMGAVYRATDTKLNRDVAVKILPDSFAADPDRLARFTREAQVLASLNHPNIAAIYGVENCALILELVDGPTLAERIAAGPIPVDEALPIARQIAEAVEYAHDRGIIHRDLKPANVKVTAEGRVKVLDFGLAKAFATDMLPGDPASSPTLTMRATMAGLIMGTAGYMAPEQAKGKAVDRRVDIWSFGVLLVEMLTGRMMYTGETVSETLAAVIKDQPDLSALPADTPPAVRRVLQRCLDKDPRRRLQAIGEARIAIEAPVEETSVGPAPAVVPVRRGAPWWVVAVAAVIPAVVLGAFLWRATRPVERPLQRFSADLGPEAVPASRTTVIVSPDGTRIAYPVQSQGSRLLATRLMDQSRHTILAGTENSFDHFFSPDGQWIGFSAAGKISKVSVQGGGTVTLCDARIPRGMAWGRDGYIYGTFDGVRLSRVPAAGGTPQVLTEPEKRGERTHRWPHVLPDGKGIVVTVGTANVSSYDDASIGVYSLQSRQFKIVQRGGFDGRYAPSGHLLYVHQGTLFAIPFDLARQETRGMAVPILEDVAANSGQAAGQFDFSGNGILVYLSGPSAGAGTSVVWMDRSGAKKPLLAAPQGATLTPRLSPDGKLLAFSVNGDLFVYDPVRGSSLRLTFAPADAAQYPVWTPDGKHIAYSLVGRGGIWWIRSDGSGKPEAIYDPKSSTVVQSISPDTKTLAFHQVGQGRDLYTLPLDLSDPDHPKAGKPEPFLITAGADVDPVFSPDGRWLAYASNESGSFHVFVRPFPEGAQGSGQTQISSAPGRFPLWSRTNKELFYVTTEGRIMVVPYVIKGRAFSPGKPEVWCDTPIGLTGVSMPLDLAPDGKRFAVFPGHETSGTDKSNLHVTFLLNFFDELKRRVP